MNVVSVTGSAIRGTVDEGMDGGRSGGLVDEGGVGTDRCRADRMWRTTGGATSAAAPEAATRPAANTAVRSGARRRERSRTTGTPGPRIWRAMSRSSKARTNAASGGGGGAAAPIALSVSTSRRRSMLMPTPHADAGRARSGVRRGRGAGSRRGQPWSSRSRRLRPQRTSTRGNAT